MSENTLLSSYCFLAALTETKSDLYQGVYIPIVKRTLSLYNLKGNEFGNDFDIQNLIFEEYGLNVPVVIIRQLLRTIESNMSRRERGQTGFVILENGKTFKVAKYYFLELEENYKRGQRNAKGLQAAFEKFISDEDVVEENIPPFVEFINKNRIKLTSFFKGTPSLSSEDFESTFIHHISFLEYIEQNHHELFQVAESIYFGSIVASFFETDIDLNAKFLNDEVYFLDTQVILKALDLQSESDTRPIIELLNLIKSSGGKLKILDITCGEISYILNNAISSFNNQNPTSTVNEACLRKGKNKTWLIAFNGKLEQNLIEVLGADIVNIPTSLKEKFQRTDDIRELKLSRRKRANAEHDVFAYLYVREQRGGVLKTFQKAKTWFLTANKNLLSFNIKKSGIGNVPEVSLPDTLTALLWLQNPTQNSNKVKSIGLQELISSTLNDEIATKELINEFDANLKSLTSIDDEDYKILLSSIAYQSANYIEKINNLLNEREVDEFNIEVHKIVDKERKRRTNVTETIRTKTLESKEKSEENNNLKSALNSLENQLKFTEETTKTEIEKLSEKLDSQTKYFKRFLVWISIFICILILYGLGNKVFDLVENVKRLVNFILALGGLWSFGSFIINLLKSLGYIK